MIAHEYGHHVQDLIGVLGQGSNDAGATGRVGAHRAAGRLLRGCVGGPRAPRRACSSRSPRRRSTTPSSAAAAVGDDRIQSATQGQVNPDQWTHGSSAQRQRWFTTGFESGDMNRCDTFGGSI